MVKKIVSLALSEDSLRKVDSASKAAGLSRSEYVDLMLSKGFHFDEEVEEIHEKQEALKKKLMGDGNEE